MSKIFMTGAVALALAAAMPAYAQTSTTRDTRPAITAATPNTMIQPDELRATKILGSTVYDVQNRNIGGVKDLILGKDGKVDASSTSAPFLEWEANTSRFHSATSKPTIIV
jgi:hypothetical protein